MSEPPTTGDVTSTNWEDTLDWANNIDLTQLDWQGMTYYPDVDEPSALGLRLDDGGVELGVGDEEPMVGRVSLNDEVGIELDAPLRDDGAFRGFLGDLNWTSGDERAARERMAKHTATLGDGDVLDDFFEDEEVNSYDASHVQSGDSDEYTPLPRESQPGPCGSTDNECCYKGVTCSCSVDQHRVDPSLSASSPLHIDRGCEILKVLGLSFHRYHRYLICGCGSFLPLGKLVDHYKKDHPDMLRDALKRYANKELIPIIGHFATSFDIPRDQTTVNFTPATFNGPIAGITPPSKRYTCLACGVSLKSEHVARVHWGSSCKRAASSTLAPSQRFQEHWAQPSFILGPGGSGRGSNYVGVPHNELENDVTPQPNATRSDPPAERYLVPDGLDAFRPPWLEALGWAVWRDKQVTAGISLEALVSFTALPSRRYRSVGRKIKSSSPLTEEERLAWVAMCIQRRLKKMMLDANSFLEHSNGELRGNLTAGYVIDSTSTGFRKYLTQFSVPVLDLNFGLSRTTPTTLEQSKGWFLR